MKKITMIAPAFDAALVPSAEFAGGLAGVFTDRGRTRVTSPKTADVSDPRPAGPPV